MNWTVFVVISAVAFGVAVNAIYQDDGKMKIYCITKY